jgi:hypothetical protein
MVKQLLTAVVALSLLACSNDEITQLQDNAVAEVQGEKLTQTDLQVAAKRSLGRHYNALDEQGKENLLNSVISAEAMAVLAKAEMTTQEYDEIVSQSQAYLKELLVRRYLKNNAIPQPVSQQQVSQYYQTHPEEFGGGSVYDVSIFTCIANNVKDNAICSKAMASDQLDVWQRQANSPQQFKLVRRNVSSLIESDLVLVTLAKGAAPQSASPVKVIDGNFIRIFNHSHKPLAPVPLISVSNEIRERLAPLQLKRAIKDAAENARNSVEIKRL